jgi:hypothetical protein
MYMLVLFVFVQRYYSRVIKKQTRSPYNSKNTGSAGSSGHLKILVSVLIEVLIVRDSFNWMCRVICIYNPLLCTRERNVTKKIDIEKERVWNTG